MVRAIADVITRGLDETIQNLKVLPEVITQGTAKQMELWYKQEFKKTTLKVIATGRPVNKIPRNVGIYAIRKKQQYGINHGLGKLSGKLYQGVENARFTVKETRGKEVRFAVIYDDPYYVAYVIEGTKFNNKRRRPFPEVAKDRDLPTLIGMLGRMFEGLDLTMPTTKLISTVLATR